MPKGFMSSFFEYVCKGLICEEDRMIALGQLMNGKDLMAHSKNNPNKGFNKNPKPHTKGSTHHSSNDSFDDGLENKVFDPCNYCEKNEPP